MRVGCMHAVWGTLRGCLVGSCGAKHLRFRRHIMRQQRRKQLRYRVSLLGRRFDITALLNEHLRSAQQVYKQVRDALNSGVDPKIAYSLPRPELFMLRRYERAVALYDEYKQTVGTPRADRIITPALPTAARHIVHFFCASTSGKQDHTYTHYKVVLAKRRGKLHLLCDCPDFVNRGVQENGAACKHMYLALFYLRDRAVAEKR